MYSFAFMINEFLLKEFGDRIKQLRLQKNISQEKLSFLTGFHRFPRSLTDKLIFVKTYYNFKE